MSEPAPDVPPSLETAMERLDAIVQEMESGELPLENLLSRYEEGMRLAKLCEETLARAEERIRIVSNDASGNPVLEDFDPGTEE